VYIIIHSVLKNIAQRPHSVIIHSVSKKLCILLHSEIGSRFLRIAAERSGNAQEIEPMEAQHLVAVLNNLVRGMTCARFGIRQEAALHRDCDAEQLREAIDA